MKRKSLIEAVSPEVRDFIEAGTPKPQFVQTQPEGAGEESTALVPEQAKRVVAAVEKKETPVPAPAPPVVHQSAGEIPLPVLVPQTFRLPQPLIEDLARAVELRALSWLDREGNTWLPITQNLHYRETFTSYSCLSRVRSE